MIKTDKMYSTHHQSQILTELLVRHGVQRVVISSGSRNAPLVISLTSCDDVKCYSVVDERAAGFFAMGLAKQDRKPVALVCTSGSAVLNYYPAVAEAYYSRIPLVVISADRPADMIDKGMGQTIHQDGVLDKHTTYDVCLSEDERDIKSNVEKVNKALLMAVSTQAPVHINVPFAEPLYDTTTTPLYIDYECEDECGDKSPYVLNREIEDIWKSSHKKMIVCGAGNRDEELVKILKVLNEEKDVIVLCENISNVYSECFIENIDRHIVPMVKEEKDFYPDLIVSIGGMLVSKKIKAFLSKAAPRYHIHIHEHVFPDTYGVLSHSVKARATDVLRCFIDVECKDGGYVKQWDDIKKKMSVSHDEYLKTIPFSDMKVWEELAHYIPSGTHLEIANSSAIRYSQLFNFREGITFGCNRGTSGIDGSTSTAIGVAVALNERPTTFVSGDLSFFYDSNALWNKYIPRSMRFIVVNNGGGGIFRILDGSRDAACCEEFLQARHGLSAIHLAHMHSLAYDKVDTLEDLHKILDDFWEDSPTARLLEIFTPVEINDTVLRDYFKYLIKSL